MESESGRYRIVKELLGFFLVWLDMSMFLTWLIGWELSIKDKLLLIVQEFIFLVILFAGVYLLTNQEP
nr:MAG TPA: hypothetical protein [Caudoviricetes sp.]